MKIRSLFLWAIIAALLGMVTACGDIDSLQNRQKETENKKTAYTVSFEANGGSPAPQNQSISKDDKVTEPAPMNKTGYGFAGWYKEAAFSNLWNFDSDTVTDNITLYAKWDSNYHTVSFVANGGNPAPQQQNIAHGYKAVKPQDMSKEDFKFEGWYKEAAFINLWDFNSDTVTENLVLYAKWGYLVPPTTVPSVPGTTLALKLQWIASNAASNTIYLLEVSSDEYLNHQNLSYNGKSDISIQLTGIGGVKTIEPYGTVAIFTINHGVTLVLNENIVLNGSVTAAGGNLIMNNGSKVNGVSVNATQKYDENHNYIIYPGIFTMNGGEISGVSVYGDNNTFTMNGGKIYNGSGVRVELGTFTMTGGEISGNTSYDYGGGVYISGTFIMTGGEISGNTSPYGGGGGVYVGSYNNVYSTFTMTGGKISGNTVHSDYDYDYGGGVYISGTFIMTGGEISGNTVHSYYGGGGGGGVYVGSDSRFEKNGGIITGYSSDTVNGNVVKNNSGNIQNDSGHAVYVAHNDNRFIRRKETTSGQGDNLTYIRNEPAPPTISGAWDE